MEYKWYFAYGSNLKRERLKKRIGKWRKERKAILRDYELVFGKGWGGHFTGKANIQKKPKGRVEGVIYLVTEQQLKKLDRREGVPWVYERITVKVESEGERIPAETYRMVEMMCPLKPSRDYLDLVLDGLREHGYDESVIEKARRKAE
jgi:cation transport regulator ChaC